MNILSNFIAHEKIVCADKDLPWFNKVIKSLILKKTFKKYRKSNNNIQLLQLLRFLQEKLNSFISVSKQNATRECQLNLLNYHKVRKHTGSR